MCIRDRLTPYTYDLYLKGKASENWSPVQATVISYKIHRGRNSRSGYKNTGGRSAAVVKVVYNYQYEGAEYEGDRTGFGPYASRQLERPKRGQATVYVNPQRPSESVYAKGVSKNNLGGLAVGIGFVLAGLYFIAIAVRAIIKD